MSVLIREAQSDDCTRCFKPRITSVPRDAESKRFTLYEPGKLLMLTK